MGDDDLAVAATEAADGRPVYCRDRYYRALAGGHFSRPIIRFSRPDSGLRTSPDEVKKEIHNCYALIHKLGRGVVYLGSSRMGPGHPHYMQTVELVREIGNLLDCTTWTGVGPGLMDAATKGALQAKKPVGGFKIEHPVPFLVMNYDLFYSKLLAFFDDCEDWGTVPKERWNHCGRFAMETPKLWST
ncbi:hypothetical protein IFM89_033242 [Coptis chinensis]|uniref:Cytokinin riboside 5'-monophosphate phosphoribohydrolase n=1 Tax=Coptis chinensis TaxID=261450 RepID=A0A835MBE9_9MAGN|nr:hypothetical protein IFM89_033242 [Coptis chinensis]